MLQQATAGSGLHPCVDTIKQLSVCRSAALCLQPCVIQVDIH